MTTRRALLCTTIMAAVAAASLPAFARDVGAPEVRDAGPGMGGPPEMNKALGVTIPIGGGQQDAGAAQPVDQTRPNCGETVTMAPDGGETVVPTPCN